MTAPAPEAIARTLTPGQRRAVLAMSAEWQDATGWLRYERDGVQAAYKVRDFGLSQAGVRNGAPIHRLTPLGLAVQARLREVNDAG